LAILIRNHSKEFTPMGEHCGGAPRGKSERYRSAAHRPLVLILHSNDYFARRALLDVIDGALALHDHDVQFALRSGLRGFA
jgi:hypothetical protein